MKSVSTELTCLAIRNPITENRKSPGIQSSSEHSATATSYDFATGRSNREFTIRRTTNQRPTIFSSRYSFPYWQRLWRLLILPTSRQPQAACSARHAWQAPCLQQTRRHRLVARVQRCPDPLENCDPWRRCHQAHRQHALLPWIHFGGLLSVQSLFHRVATNRTSAFGARRQPDGQASQNRFSQDHHRLFISSLLKLEIVFQ